MSILEIRDLKKSFGSHIVLDNLTLQIPEHSIFGLIGQNGAGKTTTMKLILGLLKADGGNIRVCGEPVRYGQTKSNRHIGYLPDVPQFYSTMTPMEYLRLCAQVTGVDRSEIPHRSHELLELVGLPQAGRRIGGFSRGMKQRLGIAQALINEPELLICDEPTSALDPVGRKDILEILHSLKGKTTVLFSTHILTDVERICDEVAVLHQGKIALNGPLAQLKQRQGILGFSLEFEDSGIARAFACALQERLSGRPVRQDAGCVILRMTPDDDSRAIGRSILELLAQKQLVPLKFEQQKPTLESLFLQTVV